MTALDGFNAIKAQLDGELSGTTQEEGAGLFKLWTTKELLAEDLTFNWRVRGLLCEQTFGPIGGEKKTLKSYVGSFIDIGVAAGVPIFGKFKPEPEGEGRPVVVYVGEGGRKPYTRRCQRIAQAMGVNLEDIPLVSSFDVAPVGSQRFHDSLIRDLDTVEPALVHLDPLYAFHDPGITASNLYERGPMLASISNPCVQRDAVLLIADHFNKTGSGNALSRLTQSGMQEWPDTWLLLSHREDPDPGNGLFYLTLEIGSRQWGGSTWDLNLDVGRFDEDICEFDGAISWDLHRADGGRKGKGKADIVPLDAQLIATVSAMPLKLTKDQLASAVGGKKKDALAMIAALEGDGRVVAVPTPRQEGDRTVRRPCYILVADPTRSGNELPGNELPGLE